MDLSRQITQSIQNEFRRRVVEESITRIKKCLDLLSEDQVWYAPNENTNSVGNLILHLSGNARQWILSGIANVVDTRLRDEEFSVTKTHNKANLNDLLDLLANEISAVVEGIEPEKMLELKKVQVFEESIISILIHVIEHFSYHTGQITYLTKYIKDVDTAYYGKMNLNS